MIMFKVGEFDFPQSFIKSSYLGLEGILPDFMKDHLHSMPLSITKGPTGVICIAVQLTRS